ncbi:hypothetical protein HELRODRAFT_182259 [Helobdella robusta]|uniref:Transformation/transcription domain-associated protein n=1 Tax=Helobdella robusta TaxID=6412 RepID=T1FI03_HELRO|nr:hypothetical protein HELRODRAFT_182259 [Helobdella robusta]ESN91104.1 hypothetical protein HELRODRAFT_182259 [Helobdella robusta]
MDLMNLGPLIPGSRMNPLSPQDPLTQLNTFKSYVAIIADSTNNIAEKKSKAVQELCENFELIVSNPHYPQFIGEALKVFIKVLNESETVFISEYTNQQLRKSLLELLQRVPANDHLKPYVQPVLSLMYKLLEIDCEENALVCLRVIIELNKSFKPPYSSDITNFLKFVKDIYTALPRHLDKLFEHRSQMKVNNITDLDISAACEDLLCTITVVTEKKNAENQNINYNLMPRATASLKVLAELPIIVVLMYQLYKQQVHNEVAEFIPLIMNTINMHPSPEQRASPQFNREIFVDFIAAQIKTLSFLAYIIRIYQDAITAHSAKMVQGMLDLLTLCPPEVAHLRKELLIASRHILATDLRTKFVPHIEKLFDEDVLFGSGWTTHESLRFTCIPLAFSTLADLVHHIRQNLTMSDLQKAVNLFSKNVHDDTLPCSIQNMSCKLLLNLVECIRSKSETENSTSNVAGRPIRGREIFLRMLEVFVLNRQSEAAATASLSTSSPLPNLSSSFSSSSSASKLKTPQHQQQQQQQQQQSNNANTCTTPESPLLSTPQQSSSSLSSAALSLSSTKKQLFVDSTDSMKALLSSTTTATSASSSAAGPAAASSSGGGGGGSVGYAGSNLGLGLDGGIGGKDDGKGLVKTLVSGVKTITWGLTSCKAVMDPVMFQNKQFLPREIHVYIRLVKFALSALDIYTINTTSQGLIQIRSPSVQTVRTKEEKEVLEHFAGVFMVNRIHANYALQIIANTFLASPTTSATFATILVEYLLLHMDEMGSSVEQSSLYLKLFKLVFGSVSLLANENEQMLKPHLHTIVNRSMELARTAKEPFNYFLLLRALFRSIGGGSHDLLYQEFLPLLPNLLQASNTLLKIDSWLFESSQTVSEVRKEGRSVASKRDLLTDWSDRGVAGVVSKMVTSMLSRV